MAETPALFDTATALVVDAVGDALDGVNPNLARLAPPDASAARSDLAELRARAGAISAAGDPVTWLGAVDRWRTKLGELAGHAFGGADPQEAMLVRVVQERLPRVAAFLVTVGVIVTPPRDQPSVDWVELRRFLRDPGTLVNEELWDALLGDAGLPGSGRLPAMIVALLILFPQTLLALARDELHVAPLELPPTDGPGPWRDYRTKSAEWLSVTLPLPDFAKPEEERVPRTLFDLASGLAPQMSATLGIRSARRPVGGRTVTDFELWLALALDQDEWAYDFGSSWILRVTPGITAGFGHDDTGWHGAFRPFAMENLSKPLGPDDPVVVTFSRELPEEAPDIALGPPYDTRLVIRDVGLFLRLRENHPIVEVGAFAHQLSVVLTNRWWRTFGATNELLGEGIRFDLDFDIAYIEGEGEGTGLQVNLAAGFDVTFDVGWKFGDRPPAANADDPNAAKRGFFDLTIHSIRVHVPIEATEESFDVRAEVRFHASLRLGPVVLVIDGLGGWVGWWTEGTPPEKEWIGFLPPTGAGVQLQLPGVVGGGFLDFTGGPNERFAGLLYLRIGTFEVTAFGIHELTGQPGDARRKTSFILVIGIRFSPGIQIGYGFAITGFGGLIGINRRADTDALRERLTSGAAGNVLFAEDPVRNAPAIIGDLGALFPPADGVYVFGPTIQISWLSVGSGKLVRFDLGIFIELPGPTKVVLLGSARASLPGDPANKIFFIRVDIVGLIDFTKKVIEFDATLISSHVMEIFKVTGDAAFRASWGDRPYVMLTLGGFHPDFNPEPAVFPELTRLALTLQAPKSGLFLRGEAYFALTTNTLQFGARLEVGFHDGSINAIGFVGLDALIQFVPFHFEVDFAVGFQVRRNELNLVGVKVTGTISGPGPVTVTGRFCIEILFWDICWGHTFTIGSASPPAIVPVGSIAQALQGELGQPANLSVLGGDDPHVALARRGSPSGVVLPPIGAIAWTQSRVPLGVPLDRFEGQPLATSQSMRVTASTPGGGVVQDWFSPGSFADLSQAETLTRPSFERLDAGLVLGFQEDRLAGVDHPYTVIEIRIPQPPQTGVVLTFPAVTLDAVLARTADGQVRTRTPQVNVGEEVFVVRGTDGSVLSTARSQSEAYSVAASLGGHALSSLDVVVMAGL